MLCFLNGFAQLSCNSGRYYSEVFSSVTQTSNIRFGASDPYGIVNNQDLYLDIFEPSGDTLEKRPLILHQFGGGFLIGWRTEPVIPEMAEMYAKRGFVFATIDYRLGFNVLDGQSAERAVYRAAQDLRAALRFLVDNADVYGIDTSAIFLTGTSAGCLSAFVSTYMNEADRVDIPSTYGILLEPQDLGCANCSGNNNFNNQEVKIHGIINNWGAVLDTAYIDILNDPADNVPVISFHGTNDLIVPYVEGNAFSLPIFPSVQGSYLIHQRLDHLGVKNKLFPLDGLGHEPQLLQLQTWVTDTIISQGSRFLYEILYGDSIEITGDRQLCVGDTASFSLDAHLGSRYCWNITGGNIISQNHNEISIYFPSSGSYILEAVELDKRQVSKQSQVLIEVNQSANPILQFTSNDGLFVFACPNSGNSYYWDFGDNSNATGPTVQHQYSDTGFYLVELRLSDAYCTTRTDTLIESSICPEASFQILQNDSSFQFVNTSLFSNEALWIDSEGSLSNSYDFSYWYEEEGTYGLSLIVSNDFCSDTLTENIQVNFCSEADFDFVSNGLQVQFQAAAYNAYFYAWDFGDTQISSLENPVHNYLLPGLYEVQLITTSILSCSDTITKTIVVDLENSLADGKDLDLQIYPNPLSEVLHIQGLSALHSYSYQLLSSEGIICSEGRLLASELSLQDLSKGVYYLLIETEGRQYSKKIILH